MDAFWSFIEILISFRTEKRFAFLTLKMAPPKRCRLFRVPYSRLRIAQAGLSEKKNGIAKILFDIASYFCVVFDLYYSGFLSRPAQ